MAVHTILRQRHTAGTAVTFMACPCSPLPASLPTRLNSSSDAHSFVPWNTSHQPLFHTLAEMSGRHRSFLLR